VRNEISENSMQNDVFGRCGQISKSSKIQKTVKFEWFETEAKRE